MKFDFNKGNSADINTWVKSNEKLEQNLLELAGGEVSESEVITYLGALCESLEVIENGKLGEMLFLKYDDPNTMPPDARVDFVYRPTYLAATIMMTAYCRYSVFRKDILFTGILKKVLNATLGRGFAGAYYESIEGLMDTLQIFAEGDVIRFIESYPDVNACFTRQLNETITYLETKICTGKVIDAWARKDTYSERGKEIMSMFQNSYDEIGKYVWYACYGSNLSKERFMMYINECKDKTPPVEDRPFVFEHNIYFAKYTKTWGGAKAFLDDSVPGIAYGRIYKITREQYTDIKRQEGRDYTKRIVFGIIDGLPVYSFTDTQKNEEVRMPSEDYYNEILKGLKECYTGILEEKEMVEYLNRMVMSAMEFEVAKEIRISPHYLSIRAMTERTGLLLEQIQEAIKCLVQYQVVRQDRRSVAVGHNVMDKDAYFYTVNSKTGRKLVQAMIDAKDSAPDTVVNAEVLDEMSAEAEGARRNIIASRIERSPKNRAMAISLHGCICQVCGFDFEKVYGELGKGYIEVHHIHPLAGQEHAQTVNPKADLVCLCANCHRMVHRSRNNTLSIEELKRKLCTFEC